MTSTLIVKRNLPFDSKVFVVVHGKARAGQFPGDRLVIPTEDDVEGLQEGYCLLTEEQWTRLDFKGAGVAVRELPPLDDGDVVLYEASHNRLEVVFQVNSGTNALYVTNECNSRCQLCPQPSSSDGGRQYELAKSIVDLVPNGGECVNVTGGEPTIRRDMFLSLVEHATGKWPETKLFFLTNGRNLADASLANDIYRIRGTHPVGFAIPLYSDAASVHDCVVGVKGAFGQTVRGLYNLAAHHAEIELRFVLSKLTYERLPNLIDYVGRNLPFVTRVAVMGIEPMGYCRAHWNDFWVDPEDCASQLSLATEKADNYSLNLVFYNFQNCCVPAIVRPRVCSAISEWKRVYLDRCLTCPMKSGCGGFFSSQNDSVYRPRRFS